MGAYSTLSGWKFPEQKDDRYILHIRFYSYERCFMNQITLEMTYQPIANAFRHIQIFCTNNLKFLEQNCQDKQDKLTAVVNVIVGFVCSLPRPPPRYQGQRAACWISNYWRVAIEGLEIKTRSYQNHTWKLRRQSCGWNYSALHLLIFLNVCWNCWLKESLYKRSKDVYENYKYINMLHLCFSEMTDVETTDMWHHTCQ